MAQTSWYENGQKSSEEIYNDGKRMTAFVWKPNGEKCHDTNLVDGNGITCRHYEKGQKKDEYSYKDGKVHGLGPHGTRTARRHRKLHTRTATFPESIGTKTAARSNRLTSMKRD